MFPCLASRLDSLASFMSFMLFLAAPTAERQHRQQQHHAAESHSRVGRHLGRHRLAKKQNAPSHRNSPPEKVNSENKPTRKSLSLLALPAICISVAAMGCYFFFLVHSGANGAILAR